MLSVGEVVKGSSGKLGFVCAHIPSLIAICNHSFTLYMIGIHISIMVFANFHTVATPLIIRNFLLINWSG